MNFSILCWLSLFSTVISHPFLFPANLCSKWITVQLEGTTCWKLSREYSVSVGFFKKINSNLKCDQLISGQRYATLSIPRKKIAFTESASMLEFLNDLCYII